MTEGEKILLDALEGNMEALEESSRKTYEEYAAKNETAPTESHDPDAYKKLIIEEKDKLEQRQRLKEREKAASDSLRENKTQRTNSSSSSERTSKKNTSSSNNDSWWGSNSTKTKKTAKDRMKEFHDNEIEKLNNLIDDLIEDEIDILYGDFGFGHQSDILSKHRRSRLKNKLDISYNAQDDKTLYNTFKEIEDEFFGIYEEIRLLESKMLNPY